MPSTMTAPRHVHWVETRTHDSPPRQSAAAATPSEASTRNGLSRSIQSGAAIRSGAKAISVCRKSWTNLLKASDPRFRAALQRPEPTCHQVVERLEALPPAVEGDLDMLARLRRERSSGGRRRIGGQASGRMRRRDQGLAHGTRDHPNDARRPRSLLPGLVERGVLAGSRAMRGKAAAAARTTPCAAVASTAGRRPRSDKRPLRRS